jgi:ribonuclease BN (tRNA processing enzyme)
MDYGRLVLQRWDQGAGRIGELNLYGPPPIARLTDQLFGVDGIYGPDIRARIEPEQPGSVRGARRHAAAPASGAESNGDPRRFGDQRRWLETYGGPRTTRSALPRMSRVPPRYQRGVDLDTGDSGPTDAIVELARGCDILIHMNHYFSGTEPSPAYRMACGNHRDNAEIAKRAAVKTLVLTHVLGQIDQPSVREQIVHEIQQVFLGKVIWGEDLMRLTPAGARVSTIESRQD